MNRLMKKNQKGFYEPKLSRDPDMTETLNGLGACVQKLGALEDIEDELGIDLITFYKALKEGIYVKDGYKNFSNTDKKWAIVSIDNKIAYYDGDIEIALFERADVSRNKLYGYEKYHEYCPFDEIDTSDVTGLWSYTSVKIKDYGKTWALTKEELE